MILKKGARGDMPPIMVNPLVSDPEFGKDYRKTPFAMQATICGNYEIYHMLLLSGRPMWELGHICLSRRRQNAVSGNVIACAAYHGESRILKFVLTKLSNSLTDQVNMPVTEFGDIRPLYTGGYVPEFEGFTPLMLAVVSEKANLEVVKQLLASQATFTNKEKQTGDNIVHLAARHCANLEILEYLVRSLNQDMLFERNKKGETPLSICEAHKNQAGIALLEKLQVTYDKSRQKTGDLLAQLELEEERAEKEKQKRKEKKYRAKLQKLAERDHCTAEETKNRLEAQKQEKLNEEQRKLDLQNQKEETEARKQQEEQQSRQKLITENKKRIAHEEDDY